MSKRRVAILLTTILLLAFISLELALIETSEIVPTSGTMYVALMNRSNATMDASLFIYVRDLENASRIRFFNATFATTRSANLTSLASIVDGSGIEVYIKSIEVNETVSFQVKNIEVSPELSINLNQLLIDLEARGKTTFYIDYGIIFSLMAWTRLGTFSVASVQDFNYRPGNIIEPLTYKRTHITVCIWAFSALVFCLLSSLTLWIAFRRWRTRIPLATLIIALSSVTLHLFRIWL